MRIAVAAVRRCSYRTTYERTSRRVPITAAATVMGAALRYLEWTWDPDPDDTQYTVDYAYLLRDADGSVRVVHDRHVEGLFPRAQWLQILADVGFEARVGAVRSFRTRARVTRSVHREKAELSAIGIAMIAFGCNIGGSLIGLFIGSRLPDHHASSESKDVVRLSMAMIATLTALVLGLVTASAKSAFDAEDAAIKGTSASVLSLDRMLADYGPATKAIRDQLRSTLADRINAVWPDDAGERCAGAGRGARRDDRSGHSRARTADGRATVVQGAGARAVRRDSEGALDRVRRHASRRCPALFSS